MPPELTEFVDVRLVPAVRKDRDASLRTMREQMVASRSFQAAVIVGGMEGVFEEVKLVGGVPYLAREAFRYLFPRRPTVVDQLKVLVELIAAAGEAKAKSLKVRISTAAKTPWEMRRTADAGEALVDGVGGGQIVDKHHQRAFDAEVIAK